jgi:hypothetical protein
MSPDVERTLREIPQLFPRPDHARTAETLRDLRATFARPPQRRRRFRWILVLAVLLAGATGAVAWGFGLFLPAAEGFPNPVYRDGTFICPRYASAFFVEINSSKYGIDAAVTTHGAPISRGGTVGYARITDRTAGIDQACRRTGRGTAGRPVGLVNTETVLPTQSTYADYEQLTCIVRGRVLVRFDFLERAGKADGVQLEVGVEGRRNLLARMVVRSGRATMRTARACS